MAYGIKASSCALLIYFSKSFLKNYGKSVILPEFLLLKTNPELETGRLLWLTLKISEVQMFCFVLLLLLRFE